MSFQPQGRIWVSGVSGFTDNEQFSADFIRKNFSIYNHHWAIG